MKKIFKALAVIASTAVMAAALVVPGSAEITGGLWAEVCPSHNVVRLITVNAISDEPVAWMVAHPLAGRPVWTQNNDLMSDELSGGRAAEIPDIIPVTDEDEDTGLFTWVWAQDPYTIGANVMLGVFRNFEVESLAAVEAAFSESVAIDRFAYCECDDCGGTSSIPETTAPQGGTTSEPETTAATVATTPAPTTVATTTTGDAVAATGVALAIIPTVIAAGAAIVAAKKRK